MICSCGIRSSHAPQCDADDVDGHVSGYTNHRVVLLDDLPVGAGNLADRDRESETSISSPRHSGAAHQVQIRLKLKHRETVEIICGAVIGPITEPREVVAGLVLDGELRIVGRSTPLKTAAARELARWLQPPRGTHPWPTTVKGTTLDRFNRNKEPVALTLVEPVAVEVSADTAWSGRSFRHPLRVLRARPELSPASSCPKCYFRLAGRQRTQQSSDQAAGSISSGPLFRALLTRSVTTLGVRTGSGMASSISCTISLSVVSG
jgi:hypothetical protein